MICHLIGYHASEASVSHFEVIGGPSTVEICEDDTFLFTKLVTDLETITYVSPGHVCLEDFVVGEPQRKKQVGAGPDLES